MCTKVYVGNLAKDATENELEKAFISYGPLKSVWVARNPAGFAFVEYEDSRDAEDAVHALDGTNICGGRVRVEMSTGKSKPKPWLRGGERSRGPPRGRRPFHPEDRCYECGGRGHYAYDCPQHRGGGRRDRPRRSSRYSRSRSRSPRRRSYSRSRSRSRSPVRTSRHKSYSRSRSHSKSPEKRRSYGDNGRDSEDR
ncbi:serine/arginine-rich splicing factor 7-like isoform X1 [Liolophura sinensis]|uniref:serine/arginine-rich splicing factor 7-like isoform X1 n=1 Tax=Liolophura sinensis TaxID=3198878 RepID=UPI00315889A6